MAINRTAGILAHVTSLPGPHGIGDLGPGAERFIDWLSRAGQRRWQIMPLVPTAWSDSPYASPSAFAGNPLLISLERLVDDGLLTQPEIDAHHGFPAERAEFDHVRAFKMPLLRRAWDRFRDGAAAHLQPELTAFEAGEVEWLPDFALFMAAQQRFQQAWWIEWEPGIANRIPDALQRLREEAADDIGFYTFTQFIFRRQWNAIRKLANDRGIVIIGDIPIFVAHDSADVWANRSAFRLLADGRPDVVAGVPPDAFSATGQLWGNPQYDWPAQAERGYRWWIDRFRNAFKLVDLVRLDHFRGFAASWVVPAGAETSAAGRWEAGPGEPLFRAVEHELGGLPIIVEDLGLITPDVHALRQKLWLPGMSVLQFAFGGDEDNAYLPHNAISDQVIYTGTHDNQTTVGWFRSLDDATRRHVQLYLGRDGTDIAWDLLRAAWGSAADTAIAPLQDILRLDDSARMNIPGTATGNWSWRVRWEQLDDGLADGLASLTRAFGRTGTVQEQAQFDPFDYSVPGTQHPLHAAGSSGHA